MRSLHKILLSLHSSIPDDIGKTLPCHHTIAEPQPEKTRDHLVIFITEVRKSRPREEMGFAHITQQFYGRAGTFDLDTSEKKVAWELSYLIFLFSFVRQFILLIFHFSIYWDLIHLCLLYRQFLSFFLLKHKWIINFTFWLKPLRAFVEKFWLKPLRAFVERYTMLFKVTLFNVECYTMPFTVLTYNSFDK